MTPNARSSTKSIVATALALAAIGVGLGAAGGWLDAWRTVELHGYLEQGFARCAFLTFREVSSAAVLDSLKWGVRLGAAFLVAVLVLERFGITCRGESLVRAVASRTVVAWTIVAVALLCAGALTLMPRERDWIGSRDIGFVIVFTLVCAAALIFVSEVARNREPSDRSRATVVGMLGALAFLAPAAFWTSREMPYHWANPSTWVWDAAWVAVALVLFAWIRVRARHTPARWFTGPLWLAAIASLVLALAPFAIAGLESSLGAPKLTARQPWNVVVIGIDTLRADETSLFGTNVRGRDTTPNLRRLAERGVVFDHAMSQASWTLPAFSSIVTGKYPHEHGAYSMVGRLRERETTMAEVAREAGYQTFGVVSQEYLKRGVGFEQGCDVFDDSAIRSEQSITGELATDAALRAFRALDGKRPFFAFVHYFDPHSDYLDHEGWTWADGYDGWLRDQIAFDNLERNRQMLDAKDLQYLRDLYDEETAFTDQQIGRVLDELEHRGLAEHTLIVLVVDHGEQFLEHGNFGHTTNLYDELVHVPLIVVPPGSKQASRRSDVVETRNVFATLLDVLDIGSPSGLDKNLAAARERSLLRAPPTHSPASETAERAFSVVWLPDSKPSSGKRSCISALRVGKWKLIHDWTRNRRMLFDLESDPGEQNSRLEQEPELAKRLGVELDEWTRTQCERGGASATRDLDQRSLEALRNLGYFGDEHK